jgi:hypothetical protein
MNAFATTHLRISLAAIETAGVPAIRVAFTLAVIGCAAIGLHIYRKRHQLFDRDPEVENDFPEVRRVRLEEITFVWSALMIVLLCICVAAWRA